jgi:hypothetical protein
MSGGARERESGGKQPTLLRIYNTVGKLVRATGIKNPRSGKTEVIIEREKLSEGLYFFEISNDIHAVARGKMIIN